MRSLFAVLMLSTLALTACTTHAPRSEVRSYGNDMLPSAEVTAFQAAHARYGYTDARIDYDAQNCAVYDGVAADGSRKQHPLSDANGARLCAR